MTRAAEATTADERLALLGTVRDVSYMLALVLAGVALAFNDRAQLAATVFGGALALAVPSRVARGVPPLAVGLFFAGAVTLAGCGVQATAILKPTCAGVRLLGAACAILDPTELHDDN